MLAVGAWRGRGKVAFVAARRKRPLPSLRFHSSLPWVLTHRSTRSLPSSLVRKIRSPQTDGVEPAMPGKGKRQATFSIALQARRQVGFLADAVAIGAAPLRPVVGVDGASQGQRNETNGKQTASETRRGHGRITSMERRECGCPSGRTIFSVVTDSRGFCDSVKNRNAGATRRTAVANEKRFAPVEICQATIVFPFQRQLDFPMGRPSSVSSATIRFPDAAVASAPRGERSRRHRRRPHLPPSSTDAPDRLCFAFFACSAR